jgi:hypothetical protein
VCSPAVTHVRIQRTTRVALHAVSSRRGR